MGLCTAAEGLKLPPAPLSSQLQEATAWPRLSEWIALREVLPPEATVLGLGELAVTARLCATGCTVSVVASLSASGLGPSQVAVTVRVTMMSESVVLAGAV